MSDEIKDEARRLLLEGLDVEAVVSATGLKVESVRGLKGSLVKSGAIEGKSTPKEREEGGVDALPGESELLESILKDAGVKKKAAVLKLVDNFGYSIESIYNALGDTGAGKSIKRTVISLWSSQQGEEIPGFIQDALKTSSSQSEGERYLTREDLEKYERSREERDKFRRLEEKVDKLLEGGGGQDKTEIKALSTKIEELQSKLHDEQIGLLLEKIEDVNKRLEEGARSQPELMAKAAEGLVKAVSETALAKSVANVSEVILANTMRIYGSGLQPIPDHERDEEASKTLVDRFRDRGLTTVIRERST